MNTEITSLDQLCNEILTVPDAIGVIWLKGFLVYLHQSKIKRLLAIFEKDYCKPKNAAESRILQKYEKQCR